MITGCLDSLERNECTELIKKYGGRVTGSVSGKTNFLIAGIDEFGETMKGSKYEKAQKSDKCEIIDEDGLFKKIQPNYDPDAAVQEAVEEEFEMCPEPSAEPEVANDPQDTERVGGVDVDGSTAVNTTAEAPAPQSTNKPQGSTSTELWTNKYKPKKVSELIGNQEAIKKLQDWLQKWKVELKKQMAAMAQAAQKKGKGGKPKEMKKAALLSGPPGIGKTSAATLVAEALGYEVLEFNASSVRSKNAIKDKVCEGLMHWCDLWV